MGIDFMENKTLRKMRFAGSWYERNSKELVGDIKQFEKETSRSEFNASGAVLPHAGLLYSGRGISEFFVNANRNARRVIILAPSHYQYLPQNKIVSCCFDAFETPLGNIEGAVLNSSSALFVQDNCAVEVEHSVEMFLPFIKNYLPQVKLMVFLVPRISAASRLEEIAYEFGRAVNYSPKEDLIIASSDFTHYGQRFGYTPHGSSYSELLEKKVEMNDKKYANLISNAEIEKIYQYIEEEQPTICGIYPAMLAAKMMNSEGFDGDLVSYYNSNSMSYPSGDFVCYASILFHKPID